MFVPLLSFISALAMGAAVAQTPPNSAVHQCWQQMAPQAVKAGVDPDIYARIIPQLQPDFSLIDKLNHQPEFKTPIWDYMANLVDDERVHKGRRQFRQHRQDLRHIASIYGVDPYIVAAIWGVESDFGDQMGNTPLLDALGTLSCIGRRQAFFRQEFFALLRIAQAGDIPWQQLKGSWAGAFGQTQFMPSTYERLAVDFNQDGRRDLIHQSTDALASTAHFLQQGGWQMGQPWGVEVALPSGLRPRQEGRRFKQTLEKWQEQGITLSNGEPLDVYFDPQLPAGLLLPAGVQGPAFLVFKNFDVLFSYNAAESYALAIAHLADRIQGASSFQTPWPTDDLGLSRQERRELQQLLLDKGYAVGAIDGVIGPKTREAIKAEQIQQGERPSGRAGQRLLKYLQTEAGRVSAD